MKQVFLGERGNVLILYGHCLLLVWLFFSGMVLGSHFNFNVIWTFKQSLLSESRFVGMVVVSHRLAFVFCSPIVRQRLNKVFTHSLLVTISFLDLSTEYELQ